MVSGNYLFEILTKQYLHTNSKLYFLANCFFYMLYQLYICQSLECLEIVYLQGRFKTYSYRVASRDFCISESWFVTTYGLDFALEIIKVKV